MFDALQAGITWAQSLPAAPKGVISMVFVLLCGLAIFVLWQRPPEPVPEKQPSGTTNQAGNAASTGQSGGVTAGLYINQAPPVTEQQKAEALSGLQSELEELANFPKRADIGRYTGTSYVVRIRVNDQFSTSTIRSCKQIL